jgi:hypothetical protein
MSKQKDSLKLKLWQCEVSATGVGGFFTTLVLAAMYVLCKAYGWL